MSNRRKRGRTPAKDLSDIFVRKKSGNLEEWNPAKIRNAIAKSADRIASKLSDEEVAHIVYRVEANVLAREDNVIPVEHVHGLVEQALKVFRPDVAESYMDYRNWVKKEAEMNRQVWEECQSIQYLGDKSNSNADSTLVSTKRVKKLDALETAQYRHYFLNAEEKKAEAAGYIYIHDKSARQDSMNCFGRETRFITNQGVKSFYDFKDGDEVIVLTHKGNWKRAVVKSYGYQAFQQVSFQRASSNVKTIRCTENHRWILKDGTETTSLSVGDKLIAAPVASEFEWDCLSKTEKMLWCLGFACADGSIISYNNMPTMNVRLCGDKTKYADRFKECGYKVTQPKYLEGDIHVLMNDVRSKQIPWLILDYTNAKFFVNGWLCADGHHNLDSHSSEYRGLQVTGSANDYIYDLLYISGYYVTNEKDLTDQETNYGKRSGKTVSYGFHSNQNDRTWFVKDISPTYTNGNEKAWCLEVEDDHSFILEGGIPTGNCCLFNISEVLSGGFYMGNIWYNEPKDLDVAFDVIGDITLMSASQQYGRQTA